MKALVATSRTQGLQYLDEMTCIEGELVFLGKVCPTGRRNPNGLCCCARTFTGMYSRGETTTALVREFDGLSRAEYEAALLASHENTGCRGRFDPGPPADELLALAASWPAGSVIGRRVHLLTSRGVVVC